MGRYRLITNCVVIPRDLEYPNYYSLYTHEQGIHVKAPIDDDYYYMHEFSRPSRLEMYFNNLYGEPLYFITKEVFLICHLLEVRKSIEGDCIEMFLKPYGGTNLELVDRCVESGIYINIKTICPTCLFLMKNFVECAPIIKTKIGELFL